MTRRTAAPFEPTPDDLRAWLESIPAEQRVNLCLFLVTTDARSVVADQIDAAVAQLVETSTYAEVGALYHWSKSNVQRRVTRHRERTGQKRAPRPRRADTADDTDRSPTAGRKIRRANRTPAFVAP